MFGIFGTIENPFTTLAPGTPLADSASGEGIVVLISNLVKLAIVIAGVYTLINIILAGYGFISAGGDAKIIQKSWERIWRSFVGLLIVASSVLIAMIVGLLIFGDARVLINPQIYAP